MKKILFLILICCAFFSCRKTELTGDYEVLQGKWKWTYTLNTGNNPDSTGFDLYLEFLPEGNYNFYKNDEIIEDGRIFITEESHANIYFIKIFKSGLGKPYVFEELENTTDKEICLITEESDCISLMKTLCFGCPTMYFEK